MGRLKSNCNSGVTLYVYYVLQWSNKLRAEASCLMEYGNLCYLYNHLGKL